MGQTLLRSADECDETMAGLQVFLDHIPALEPEILECIEDLLEISAEFRELDLEISSLQAADPEYQRHYRRLLEDIKLNLRSLQYTIRNVRGMFRETRHEKYSGARPYRRAWEDLEDLFKVKQRGPSLHSRLETINIFLQNVLAALRKYENQFILHFLEKRADVQVVSPSTPKILGMIEVEFSSYCVSRSRQLNNLSLACRSRNHKVRWRPYYWKISFRD